MKHRIGRQGPARSKPSPRSRANSGAIQRFLIAHDAVLAGMGVQPGNGQPGRGYAEIRRSAHR